MPVSLNARPLKVCTSCNYWVYRHKGLCTRLNQGVGKFWLCENWAAADDRPLPLALGNKAPIPPSP
jgi:hypothetical protein